MFLFALLQFAYWLLPYVWPFLLPQPWLIPG